MLRGLAVGVICLFAGVANAGSIDLSFSDETGYIQFHTNMDKLFQGGAEMGAGVLFDENDNTLFTADVMVTSQAPEIGQPYQIGVGMKGYFADLDRSIDVAALGVGGKVTYVIASQYRRPSAISAYGYFSPSVITFGDSKRIWEYGIDYELEIIPTAFGYIGYRAVEAKLDSGEVPDGVDTKVIFDDRLHVGLKFIF